MRISNGIAQGKDRWIQSKYIRITSEMDDGVEEKLYRGLKGKIVRQCDNEED